MSAPIVSRETNAEPPIIDCCVHHHWSQTELMDYMSEAWRTFLGSTEVLPRGAGTIPLLPSLDASGTSRASAYTNPFGENLPDSYPDSGPPGSSYELVCAQLLDRYGIDYALLTHAGGVVLQSLPNPHLAEAVARAINDWTIEQWLERDSRLLSAVMISNQVPEHAAKEIRRVGQHPRFAAVVMAANSLGKPFGHPLFDPIYRAAADLGLALLIVAGANATPDQLAPTAAAGPPATWAEYDSFAGHSVMTHVVSTITQGIFEKYRELRVLVVGCGVTWIPPLLWRFETNYRGLRREAPWLRSGPINYFRDHFLVGTGPLESVPAADLAQYLGAFGGLERVLCYASGYPKAAFTDPASVAAQLPTDWSRQVLYENASERLSIGTAVRAANDRAGGDACA